MTRFVTVGRILAAADINDEVVGGISTFLIIVFVAFLLVLWVLWIILPFIVLRAARAAERAADEAKRTSAHSAAAAQATRQLVAQMKWLSDQVYEMRTGRSVPGQQGTGWPGVEDDTSA